MKILIFSFLVSFAQAKTFIPQDFSKLATDRAPYIKMYLENQAASEGSVKQAKLLANPIFTFQGGQLRSGGQKGAVVDLTLNQPIPWPGKREAAIRSQEIMLKVAQVDLDEAKLFISHHVTLLAYQIALAAELETHNAERKRRFSLVHRYLTSRPLASPRQQVEKDMLENQIRMFQKVMLEISARKAGLTEELSLWTGERDFSVTVQWDKMPKLPEKNTFENNLDSSPRLMRSVNNQRLAENRVKEARVQARPDIFVGVNYRQENIAPTNHFYHAQVGVVLPIIDYGQRAVEVANANVRKEEARNRMTMQELLTEVNQAYPILKSNFESMAIFPIDYLHHLEKSFERAEIAFRKGQIDVVSFIQTDSQIHEYVDMAYTSRVSYLSSLSQLELLIGQKLEL